MSGNTWFRSAAPALAGLVMVACVAPADIAHQALNANIAVETSHNHILLLNILRAAEGKPLYFTSLNQLFGPLGNGQVTADLSLPFNSSMGRSLGLNLTPQQPNYNISVQDDREFFRGLLNPVAPGVFGYYLRRQGSSPGMILKLFVEDVLIVDAQGVARRRYANDPNDQAALAEFARLVSFLEDCDLRVRLDTAKHVYGPPVGIENLSLIKESRSEEIHFEPLEPALSASEESPRYQPYILFSSVILDIATQRDALPCMGIPDGTGGHLRRAGFVYGNKSDSDTRNISFLMPDNPRKDHAPARDAIITLRSPEAMIQYLGSLSRQIPSIQQQASAEAPSAADEKIFHLQRLGTAGMQPPEGSISLTYLGNTYYVRSSSRSVQVLSLISQVIGMQKGSNSLPGVGTFRVLP